LFEVVGWSAAVGGKDFLEGRASISSDKLDRMRGVKKKGGRCHHCVCGETPQFSGEERSNEEIKRKVNVGKGRVLQGGKGMLVMRKMGYRLFLSLITSFRMGPVVKNRCRVLINSGNRDLHPDRRWVFRCAPVREESHLSRV